MLNATDDSRQQAAAVLCAKIDRLVLSPGAKPGQVAVDLHGNWAGVLNLAHAPEQTGSGFVVSMVAGEGLEPPPRGVVVQSLNSVQFPHTLMKCRNPR